MSESDGTILTGLSQQEHLLDCSSTLEGEADSQKSGAEYSSSSASSSGSMMQDDLANLDVSLISLGLDFV